MYYTRKDSDLGREASRVTQSRLMEEEARHRHEEHVMRWSKEPKPLPEKVKEMVGAR
jgi:hypothetical protein